MKLLSILTALLLGIPSFAGSIVLSTQNTVNFRGGVDGESITQAQMKLAELVIQRGGAGYPIYLVFDSPGGSIMAGDAFIQFAKTLKNVHTISIFAASMASGIVEAMPGKRYITKNGILMFHRAQGSFEGQFEDGEVEQQLALWKIIVRAMEQTNADRMSMPLAEYKLRVKDEYWMYGQDAVAKKAADEVVDILCTPELIKSFETTLQNTIFGSFSVTWSGCPLFRAPIQANNGEREQ